MTDPSDAARDARVAARRAADARKAGTALERLIASHGEQLQDGYYYEGWRDGYVASEEHHNDHHGVPRCVASLHVPTQDPNVRCHVCGAADARKAGRALDEMQAEGRWRDVSILSHEGQVLWLAGYDRGYADAHRQCEQQHNDHYRAPMPGNPCSGGCCDPAAHAEGGHDV